MERCIGSDAAASASCPFCGLAFEGSPNRCPRCGQIVGESAKDIKRQGEEARRVVHRRKTFADLAFLAGLLAGGPLMTLTGHTRLGLFLVLAGGLASTLHRYAQSSEPATLLIGGLVAGVVAVLVTDPSAGPEAADDEGMIATRGAYLEDLASALEETGGSVEARGPGLTVAWLYLPTESLAECGSYPLPEVRHHLAELGFKRIVIANQAEASQVCSFRPE